jgi:hypothetical protein
VINPKIKTWKRTFLIGGFRLDTSEKELKKKRKLKN